jgi:UDP-2-acetamido-2,6-beta-L-arabino-hexul-4-ose reductase
MNRGDDEAILRTNVVLAEELVAACQRTGSTPHIIFANSTHSAGDTPYGRSKRRAAEVLSDWVITDGGHLTDLVLPHVFGERGRPFYNSVVSTFCHLLAHGEPPIVEQDAPLELLHAQRLADLVHELISRPPNDPVRRLKVPGIPISVGELSERLLGIDSTYRGGVFPALSTTLELDLFNTYRSYLFPQHYPMALVQHTDHRGSLFEAVKGGSGGQTFVSTSRPGIVRGNHFHLRKVERFLVLDGEGSIYVRGLFDEKIHEFTVSGQHPVIVDIPTLHSHNIVNTGNTELLALFWAHEIFDREIPDTYSEAVSPR